MKKNYLLTLVCSLLSYVTFSQVTISPAQFNVTDPITITVSFTSATCNSIGTNPVKVYMHAGIGNTANAFGLAVVGNWGIDDGVGLMTNNGNGTWSKTITPSTYFGLTAPQQLTATKMGMVFRNPTGSQTLKLAPSCTDFTFNVGIFQATLSSPIENSSTIIASSGSLAIAASNTNGTANYSLFANGVSINTSNGVSSYAFNHTGITTNQVYDLQVTQGATTLSKKFNVVVNPTTISQALPSASLEDGINYNTTDASKATLVLDAPGKDFVYVAGSFNNWQPDASYAMKKDPTSGKFWLELTGLTSGTDYTYQYWVVDETPIANSPKMVKTADPYSTLVLSPFDDPGIPASSYPNLPAYPVGQEREVTVLKTGQTPYPWLNTNFAKPKKEDLVVYEVLIRDFDVNRNFQSLIDKIDYFKNLKINAIQLMPIMEFEGNESWGYNTAYHMALDKFYGTSSKLKEFVDLCHTNGIAVILDVALNHAYGRNAMERMWMNDPDGDGWGDPSTDNPYFNAVAKHSYSVGSDFNHASLLTKNYVKRVIKQWVQEYKIDGFRWDLTKGFTQACTATDQTCTNAYQADRVAILKDYADYSWNLDPTHYTIFEHLGIESEEKEWANYRIAETPSKGVMLWGQMNYNYSQLLSGKASGGDISGIGSKSRSTFIGKRIMGYPESHDTERMMYTAMTSGDGTGTAPALNNLNNALGRMSAIGAASLLVPGPKMIWHFADLGMGDSIYTCTNGTLNTESDPTAGDCKTATKPQPQWANNWLTTANRSKIYNDWAKMISLKINEPVFEGDYTISPDVAGNLSQRIYIFDNTLPTSQLKNVVVLCNFSNSNASINPNFPYPGTWYNLMDNSSLIVTNVTTPVAVVAGQSLVYGNKPNTLSSADFELTKSIALFPNPAIDSFSLSSSVSTIEVCTIAGQVVKSFKGNFDTNQLFAIDDLRQGIYLVKITDDNKRFTTIKLVKE
jgi:Alpha amylase, catalytic domain/Secretion system C-terminal sorting domain